MNAFDKYQTALKKILPKVDISEKKRILEGALLPESEECFKYGCTPQVLHGLVRENIDGLEEEERQRNPKIQKEKYYSNRIREAGNMMYEQVWEGYREMIVKHKVTLGDRLKDEYAITVVQLSKMHRKAVARRRQTRTNEAGGRVVTAGEG